MIRRVAGVLLLLWVFSPAAVLPATLADEPTSAAPAVSEDDYELYRMFVDTVDQIERNYVQDISHRELIDAAIEGMIRRLDPYSSYIKPEELRDFRTSVENRFGGIGIQIDIQRGQLRVSSPLVGTPAYRAGLKSGDRIVEIEGKSTEGFVPDDAVDVLRGEPGSTVSLTIVSSDGERRVVEVTREVIRVPTVLGDVRNDDDSWQFMLDRDKHIGYIRVTAFSRETVNELRRAMDELVTAELRGLIIDLRFNSGGLLRSAIDMSDMFISEGRIVSIAGRNSVDRAWDASKDDTYEGFPMVVLVNRFSASASEIMAACLQDHKRAIIVGERTWGKGSVQNVVELEEGHSALKLTTAGYRRPSGKNIHRFPDAEESDEWGVMPDEGMGLKLDNRELGRLVAYRRLRDIVRPHDAGEPAAEAEPATDKPATDEPAAEGEDAAGDDTEDVFVDRQLQMAVDYLTAELAKAE